MISRIFLLIWLLLLGLIGCTVRQPLAPELAQTALTTAWHAEQHVVWEIEWSAMPVGGALTVETWRASGRHRIEILESAAPHLVGETLIFDGQHAWRYNRFDAEPPAMGSTPWLAPVSEAFAMIRALINTPADTATQSTVHLSHGPARRITLTYNNNDRLTFWIDQETQLPARVFVAAGRNRVNLKARSFEILVDPPAGLFKPDL